MTHIGVLTDMCYLTSYKNLYKYYLFTVKKKLKKKIKRKIHIFYKD